jgi:hypothetical protein
LDKRRRDVVRFDDWWWTNIYDEDGEIGEQAKEPPDTYVEKAIDATEWIRTSLESFFTRTG